MNHPADNRHELSDAGRLRRGQPGGDAGVDEAERLAKLTHELNNLLDGSLRCLMEARRSMPDGTNELPIEQVESARRHLETVQGGLVQMGELLRHAMRGAGTPIANLAQRMTLGEAVYHAIDIHEPIARQQGVTLSIDVQPEAGTLPAGPLYTVIVNGIRNAMESINRRQGDGTVKVSAWVENGSVVLEVLDDGQGVDADAAEGMFAHGRTTKASGSGLGLAIARSVADALGGRISLAARADGPGAALRTDCTVEALRESSRTLGGLNDLEEMEDDGAESSGSGDGERQG